MKRMMAASFCFVVTPFMCDCAAVTSADNYTFYMFYTDKSNGQSKGEILSNQNHTSKGPTA